VTAHTAAGKLQGLREDALWYEAAHVVGVTNALNVVADASVGTPGLDSVLPPVDEATAAAEAASVFADIRAFYARPEVPLPFRIAAADPGYLADLWAAVRRAFADNQLPRRLKEGLAFAVSVTSGSAFGAAFHGSEMRRLGVGIRGILEVLGVTQMFSSYTKIADTLQLEPDMGHIAPVDPLPAPGGRGRVSAEEGDTSRS
jgi:AhpD family alkylhydroperoxidase